MRYVCQKSNILTVVVRLCVEVPAHAREEISPRKIEFKVLKKLDFPALICPTSKILTAEILISGSGL